MSDLSAIPPAASATRPQSVQLTAREQLRQRVRGYKRGLTVAALLGFSAFGVLIGYPHLSTATTTTTTNSTTTQSTSSSTSNDNPSSTSSTFLNQQGGNNNGTSTQAPATSSSTS